MTCATTALSTVFQKVWPILIKSLPTASSYSVLEPRAKCRILMAVVGFVLGWAVNTYIIAIRYNCNNAVAGVGTTQEHVGQVEPHHPVHGGRGIHARAGNIPP